MWRHTELMTQLRMRDLTGWLARADGCRNYDLGDCKAAYLVGHLTALGLTGDQCVLIGDTVDDAEAAVAVGARCVLYAGGITDREKYGRPRIRRFLPDGSGDHRRGAVTLRRRGDIVAATTQLRR
jgi:hypothetical protein